MAKPAKPPKKGGRPRLNPAFARSLRHYWPLQEGKNPTSVSQFFADLCVPSRPLAVNGSPSSWSSVPAYTVNGFSMMAVKVGSGQVFITSGATESVGLNFTIGAWIRTITGTGGVFLSHSGDFNTINYYIGVTAANKPEMAFSSPAGTFRTLTGNATIPGSGSLTLVIGTYDGANMRLYVNGRQDSSVAQTLTPVTSATELNVGGLFASTSFWTNGLVAHPFIMDRPMTPGEVLRLYWNPDLFIDDLGDPILPTISIASPQTLALTGVADDTDAFGTLGVGVEQRLNLVGVADDTDAFGTLSISINPGGTGGKLVSPGLQSDPGILS